MNLVYGGHPRGDGEMAEFARSLQSLLGELGAGVETPAEDIAQGRATPRTAADAVPLRVRASLEPSVEAALAVRYRERWF